MFSVEEVSFSRVIHYPTASSPTLYKAVMLITVLLRPSSARKEGNSMQTEGLGIARYLLLSGNSEILKKKANYNGGNLAQDWKCLLCPYKNTHRITDGLQKGNWESKTNQPGKHTKSQPLQVTARLCIYTTTANKSNLCWLERFSQTSGCSQKNGLDDAKASHPAGPNLHTQGHWANQRTD